MINQLINDLNKYSNKEKAKIYARFFKTGRGEYGEGDKFLGVMVPEQREVAKKYVDLDFSYVQKLLDSKIHEHRLTGLLILNYRFMKYPEKQKEIYDFYVKNFKAINNWDLVDVTSSVIIGRYLSDKTDERKILYDWIKNENVWVRRIAIISTFSFIKNNDFKDTLNISEILLNDKHDLIHKAIGWMLREIGKKDEKVLIEFLDNHYKKMPRTMLRYSVEKLDKNKKEFYMKR